MCHWCKWAPKLCELVADLYDFQFFSTNACRQIQFSQNRLTLVAKSEDYIPPKWVC